MRKEGDVVRYVFSPREKPESICSRLQRLDGKKVKISLYLGKSPDRCSSPLFKTYEGKIKQDGRGFHFCTDDDFIRGECDISDAIESGKYSKVAIEAL